MTRQTHIRFNKPEPGVMMKHYLDYVRSVIDGRHVPHIDCSYRTLARKLAVPRPSASADEAAVESAQTAGDGGDDGDGDSDGDGDPDSDRTASLPSSQSPLYPPVQRQPENLPDPFLTDQQHLPRSKELKHRRQPRRTVLQIYAENTHSHWRYYTRAQWLCFGLVLVLLAVAIMFAFYDKDWLASIVLGTTIPLVVKMNARPPQQ